MIKILSEIPIMENALDLLLVNNPITPKIKLAKGIFVKTNSENISTLKMSIRFITIKENKLSRKETSPAHVFFVDLIFCFFNTNSITSLPLASSLLSLHCPAA